MPTNSKLCANGLPGYHTESGDMYSVKKPCSEQASHGSIYCTKCRRGAGGYLRTRVQSDSQRYPNTALHTEI